MRYHKPDYDSPDLVVAVEAWDNSHTRRPQNEGRGQTVILSTHQVAHFELIRYRRFGEVSWILADRCAGTFDGQVQGHRRRVAAWLRAWCRVRAVLFT